MPTRLTRPGAIGYGIAAVLLGVHVGWMTRQEGYWQGLELWVSCCNVVAVGLTGVLYALAALTRRPLVGEGNHLLTRRGWMAVLGLTAFGVLVSFVGELERDPFKWTAGVMILYLPWWVQKLEAAYWDGVAEARVEAGLDPVPPEFRAEAR